jgi:TetR/AcrR family transcriptional regulator
MSYIAERREDEKERRRGEILDAAEALYVGKGWEALTVDQVARSARLSRALVYVYFKDKEDLLFGIGERAMRLLRERFVAALATRQNGMDQIEAIGRAYIGYAHEFPHFFDFCSRFQSHSDSGAAGSEESNENACKLMGDQVLGTVVQAIHNGITDGSVRADIGDPRMFAMTLWAFTHGIIQLALIKGDDLARHGVATADFTDNAFVLIRRMAQGSPAT